LSQFCFPESPNSFFAFELKNHIQLEDIGWTIYDAEEEHRRLKTFEKDWRLTHINSKFGLSDSYPHLLVVPGSFSDEDLEKVGAFRSKGRIPVCVWRHPQKGSTLSRSSQPLVGVKRARSAEDERLLEEVRPFQLFQM
jgi:hypothetical protein